MLAVVRFSVVGCLAGLDGAFSSVKLGNELEKPRVFSHCCIDHRWLGDLFYNHGSFTPNTVNNQRFCPVNNCQIDLQYFNFLPVIDSIFQLFFSDSGRFSDSLLKQGFGKFECSRTLWHLVKNFKLNFPYFLQFVVLQYEFPAMFDFRGISIRTEKVKWKRW